MTYKQDIKAFTSWASDDYIPSGSSLKGTVTASYGKLVVLFGEPNILNAEPSGDDKVHNEWCIRFEDGDDDIYATIYDWKEMDAYDSHFGEYRWHIGGHNMSSLWCVMEALGK